MTQTARLYGDSLYDLAAGENLTETMLEQTDAVRKLFRENPDYVRLLSEPSIPGEERKGMIETAFGAQAERYLINFLKLLCERGLLHEYAGCCDQFRSRYNADNHISEAKVISAVALTPEQEKALTEKLEQISGKKVCLTQIRDASVLGGLRVELDGKQLDGTLKGRLSGIKKTLNEMS